MSYSNNPLLPKARADALRLVIEQDLPLTIAARKSGIHRSTLWRWKRKWLDINQNVQLSNSNRPTRQAGKWRLSACKWSIPTLSCRPHHSPGALPSWIVERIVYWRGKHNRCAGVVHAHCLREGTKVSLASVKRVLKRLKLLRPVSKWKRYRQHVHRPLANAPGELIQTDTVHLVDVGAGRRVYLYTLIDIYSRWSYVEYHESISQVVSLGFLMRGQDKAGFNFKCIQSDNGSEFGRWLNDQLQGRGIVLRHSRVRKPNDNAFIERFNRTIQEEGIHRSFPKPETIHNQLEDYLAYYNHERLHSSLQYRTPAEMLQRS
ncbi:MAG TPA: integrase core domain-containing protein [Candidatus Saccharimonadales bacterium]|jgi:putative transposase|nr:integrase core domain-containing protein [Candidatus Saccharimonadales bacterium]